MSYLNDSVLDAALNVIDTGATQLDILNAEVTLYASIAGASLGNKTGINFAAPADRTGGGRQITLAAITDGSVTATDDATHWCVHNASDTLYACHTLASLQAVTSGNTFTLTEFEIGIPDPA